MSRGIIWFVLILGLPGCIDFSGAPCTTTASCPAGQSCQAGRCLSGPGGPATGGGSAVTGGGSAVTGGGSAVTGGGSAVTGGGSAGGGFAGTGGGSSTGTGGGPATGGGTARQACETCTLGSSQCASSLVCDQRYCDGAAACYAASGDCLTIGGAACPQVLNGRDCDLTSQCQSGARCIDGKCTQPCPAATCYIPGLTVPSLPLPSACVTGSGLYGTTINDTVQAVRTLGPYLVGASGFFRARLTASADLDLFVAYGRAPDETAFDCRSAGLSGNEFCGLGAPSVVNAPAYVNVQVYRPDGGAQPFTLEVEYSSAPSVSTAGECEALCATADDPLCAALGSYCRRYADGGLGFCEAGCRGCTGAGSCPPGFSCGVRTCDGLRACYPADGGTCGRVDVRECPDISNFGACSSNADCGSISRCSGVLLPDGGVSPRRCMQICNPTQAPTAAGCTSFFEGGVRTPTECSNITISDGGAFCLPRCTGAGATCPGGSICRQSGTNWYCY